MTHLADAIRLTLRFAAFLRECPMYRDGYRTRASWLAHQRTLGEL